MNEPCEICPVCGRSTLTDRSDLNGKELETLRHVLQGTGKYRRIAEQMKTTEQVVKNRMHKVFRKTGVRNRLDLVTVFPSLLHVVEAEMRQ